MTLRDMLDRLPLGIVVRHACVYVTKGDVTYGCVLFSVSGIYENTTFRDQRGNLLAGSSTRTARHLETLLTALSIHGKLTVEEL